MSEAENIQSWAPLKEAIEDLWEAFLCPPIGHLMSFCTMLLQSKEKRIPREFLLDFIDMFNSISGKYPFESLAEHLRSIIKKSNWNGLIWTYESDPAYEITILGGLLFLRLPRSLMTKQFQHVRDKMKKREREMRHREKMNEKALMDSQKLIEEVTAEEVAENVRIMNEAADEIEKEDAAKSRKLSSEARYDRYTTSLAATTTNMSNRHKNCLKKK